MKIKTFVEAEGDFEVAIHTTKSIHRIYFFLGYLFSLGDVPAYYRLLNPAQPNGTSQDIQSLC